MELFSLMLISYDLPVLKCDCFRIPFLWKPGRDILAVDILVSRPPTMTGQPDALRVCTTDYILAADKSLTGDQTEHALAHKVYHGNPSRNRNIVASLMLSNATATTWPPRRRPITEYEAQCHAAVKNGEETPSLSKEFLMRDLPQATEESYKRSRRSVILRYGGTLEAVSFKTGKRSTRYLAKVPLGPEANAEPVQNKIDDRPDDSCRTGFPELPWNRFLDHNQAFVTFEDRRMRKSHGRSDNCGFMAKLKIAKPDELESALELRVIKHFHY